MNEISPIAFVAADYIHGLTSGQAFTRVGLPSGMIMNDVTILTGRNGPWASAPFKPQVNRDRQAYEDANGKLKYVRILEFKDKATRDLWSNAVCAAVQKAHPEAIA